MPVQEVCRIKHDKYRKIEMCRLKYLYAGQKIMYRPEEFTIWAGRSRLYGSSPQAKVAWEDLQMSLIRRRISAGVSSCVECWVGSMGPLI
jgi:hypothetical protein